ncbi:SSI family serine proteinase inhibitor [Saccharopolyspora pogona]|uniref:SSI family serine proteinase inhibitor n=1 Tax=Saccharopolyspora pogona TaxID=333966 RepID=UPI001688365E
MSSWSCSHPNAAKACEVLAAVEGEFANIPTQSPNADCPFVRRPVGVTATGLWGRSRSHMRVRSPTAAPCSANSASSSTSDDAS